MKPSPLASASEYHNKKNPEERNSYFLGFFSASVCTFPSSLVNFFLGCSCFSPLFCFVPVCSYRFFSQKKEKRTRGLVPNKRPQHPRLITSTCAIIIIFFWILQHIVLPVLYLRWKRSGRKLLKNTFFFSCFRRPPIILLERVYLTVLGVFHHHQINFTYQQPGKCKKKNKI